MNDYNCSCVAGYTGKNCSIGKPLGTEKTEQFYFNTKNIFVPYVYSETIVINMVVTETVNFVFGESQCFTRKFWSWKFIKPRCNGGRWSTFAGNSALLPSDVIDFAMSPAQRFWRETVSL